MYIYVFICMYVYICTLPPGESWILLIVDSELERDIRDTLHADIPHRRETKVLLQRFDPINAELEDA